MSDFGPVERAIKLHTYADLLVRERFVPDLNPKEHQLHDIIWDYTFEKKAKCGLSNCHEPHNQGFLIVTKDGTETNIGWKCAKREFPELFLTLHNVFKARKARVAHLDVIEEYQPKVPAYKAAIDELWGADRGVWWAEKCHNIFSDYCPTIIKQHIAAMANSGDWNIYRYEDVQAEDSVGLGFRRDDTIERVKTGYFRGGPATLKTSASILRPLRHAILSYATLDPMAMRRPQRREWANWSATVPEQISIAGTLLTHAQQCFVPDNLRQLRELAKSRKDEADLDRAIQSIAAVPPRYQSIAS